MKFDLVSDLHLDVGNGIPRLIDTWVIGAETLIMAGDIVEIAFLKKNKNAKQKLVREFFKFVSSSYKQVFWVFGNHEHYHGIMDFDFDNATAVLRKLNITNIQILKNDVVELDDVIIFGATLWTSMRDSNPIVIAACAAGMNDYVMINRYDAWLEKKVVTPEDTVMLHKQTISHLKKFIDLKTDKSKIVVTHHAPCFLSVQPEYRENKLTDAYATELSEMIFDTDIVVWCHGHMHDAVDYELEQCRIVSNPRGYFGYESVAYKFRVKTITN